MTVSQLVVACRRLWLTVVVCLMVTAGGVWVARSNSGVYWAQTDVVLLGPQSVARPNAFQDTPDSLVALAGILERRINDGRVEAATSSSSVSLIDEGIYSGWSVTLPNAGGQWAYNFNRPVLNVQASGPDVATVKATQQALLGQITDLLARVQTEAGVDRSYIISAQASPASIQVHYAQGRLARAELVIASIGVCLTVSLVAWLDIRQHSGGASRRRTVLRRRRLSV